MKNTEIYRYLTKKQIEILISDSKAYLEATKVYKHGTGRKIRHRKSKEEVYYGLATKRFFFWNEVLNLKKTKTNLKEFTEFSERKLTLEQQIKIIKKYSSYKITILIKKNSIWLEKNNEDSDFDFVKFFLKEKEKINGSK